jgi:hypothetical protein
MLQQKRLATAIAVAIGTSAAAVSSVQAGSALFPFLVEGPTVTSIVSVMNGAAGENPRGYLFQGNEWLHYSYYYKLVADDNALAGCAEKNVYRSTSPFDIQTMDLGNHFGQDTLGVLFNDPSVLNDWESYNQSYSLANNIAPHRAYLVVDNSEGTMSGEAFIFEVASGATWGYQAFKDPDQRAANADFTGFAAAVPSQVALMPWEEITTKFAVTPVHTQMAGLRGNNYRTELYMQAADQFGATGAMYDRDELPVSGTVRQPVTCIGAVVASTLLTDALAEVPDGGWTEIYTDAPTGAAAAGSTPVDNAIIFKVEYGENTFNGENAGLGVFNNGIYLMPE